MRTFWYVLAIPVLAALFLWMPTFPFISDAPTLAITIFQMVIVAIMFYFTIEIARN